MPFIDNDYDDNGNVDDDNVVNWLRCLVCVKGVTELVSSTVLLPHAGSGSCGFLLVSWLDVVRCD